MKSLPSPRFRRILRCTSVVLALAGPAAVHLGAAAVGTSHPASGAYSPVNQPSWGSTSWPLGTTFTAGPGSNLEVGVYSANATNVVLEIYLADTGADATYDYTMTKGPDNIWRAAVAGVPAYTLYAFRAWGPNWPFNSSWTRGNSAAGFITDCDASGNRFNPNKVLFDPYARELSHDTWTPAMQAAEESYSMYTSGGTSISPSQTYNGPLSGRTAIDCRKVDTGHWAPKAVALADTTSTGPKPNLNQKDAIIYETHLKGLTAHPSSVNLTTLLSSYSGFQDAANVPDNLRGTYAGAAYMAGYLKDLGFNTVEFLPIHETDNSADATTAPSTSGGGYWGYYTYGFFAPDRRYASNQALGGPTAEFKAMVAAFHNAGIEVYLDVVYNHSGEGGVWDANTAAQAELTFFRGLDNASYYTLVAGTPQYYWVSTGVGTNLNGGSAPVQQLITDSLTYWTNTMGVDGFRFDEAAELGRNGSSNFSSSAPLLVSIASLASTNAFKIVAEPWDGNDGGEIGNFPPGWACWNGNYRDSVRLYLTVNLSGYVNGAGNLGYADAFYGDYNKMNAEGGPQKSVNMIVCHDGFTMTDLVSYGMPPANSSLLWPFGPAAGSGWADYSSGWGGNQTLRRQVIRDFWTFQVLSRGLPMMVWGDEFGRTVNGNNNAYNIDSVATWNNYNMIGTSSPDTVSTGDTTGGTMGYDNNLGTFAGAINGNFAFLQYLLHLRGAHPAFRQQDFTSEAITFTNAAGSGSFDQALTSTVEIYLHGSQVGDDDFLVLSNLATSSVAYTVPVAPANTHWVRIIDTNSSAESAANRWSASTGSTINGNCTVGSQSIVVLEAMSAAPAISIQPLDATINAGQNSSFTVTASGSPALTYQWQREPSGSGTWADLTESGAYSGTTTSVLTVSSTTPAMNGDQFRCVVSSNAGSATSIAAMLTVDQVQIINAISYNSTTFPATATTGATVSFTCNVTNTGTNTWGVNHYLVLRDANNGNLSFASLSGVGPGATTTVTLQLTAPASQGSYTYYLQGLENNVAYFSTRETLTLVVSISAGFTADFNGDGKADLLWSNTANGDRYLWLMNGGSVTTSIFLGTIAPQWSALAGDFNGDAKADLLWSNSVSGDRYLWLMNGGSVSASIFIGTIAPQWAAIAGDFNGDGKTDLLWSNSVDGDRYLWLMDGGSVAGSVFLGTIAPQWTAIAGDFNGDGKADLLWSNSVNGDRYLWLMNGGSVAASIFLGTIAPQWAAVTGDFNGDLKADLLWSNSVNGDRYLWLMNGGSVTTSIFLGTIPTQWTAATGDFNGDGNADLVWSSTTNGDRYLWLMNGGSVSASIFLGTVGTQWLIGN